jgi:16S rRNA (guanine527-N7)-methyltransferase
VRPVATACGRATIRKAAKVPDSVFGPEEFATATNVSRETLSRLKAYADVLVDWNERHNLVAKGAMADLWRRHFWDSAQLAPLVPSTARTLADLGSGAGFPGLVLAAMLPQLAVTLYEATAKKCAFLSVAAERMQLPNLMVENARMEDVTPRWFDVVTARACAPLLVLLGYAQHFQGPNTVSLFLKGQNVGSELTDAAKSWTVKIRQIPSLTDPSGVILELRELASNEPIEPQNPRAGRRQSKRRRR